MREQKLYERIFRYLILKGRINETAQTKFYANLFKAEGNKFYYRYRYNTIMIKLRCHYRSYYNLNA